MDESFGDMFERDLQANPEAFQIRRAEKTKKYWTSKEQVKRILDEHQKLAQAEDEYTRYKIQEAVKNGGKIIAMQEMDFLIHNLDPIQQLPEKKYPIMLRYPDQYNALRTSSEFNAVHLLYQKTIARTFARVDKILADRQDPDYRYQLERIRENTKKEQRFIFPESISDGEEMFEIMNTLHQKICEIYAYFGIH